MSASAPPRDAEDVRQARRAEILVRYPSEAAALTPCSREIALREGTWAHVVPGTPETGGPSLMGWQDGPVSSLTPQVLRDVATAIRPPATAAEAWAEHHHWAERAELREILGGPPLPVWVRARRAFLASRLDALLLAQPDDEAARAEWCALAGESSPAEAPNVPAPTPPGEPVAIDPAPDAERPAEPAPSNLDTPPRTREEARVAVRALLGQDLTDREIARRVGVSPSTVAAVRKQSA